MKRYSILVVEHGRERERELCQCDGNPQAIVDAAMAKTVTIDTGTSHKRIPKYSSIRIVENKT